MTARAEDTVLGACGIRILFWDFQKSLNIEKENSQKDGITQTGNSKNPHMNSSLILS